MHQFLSLRRGATRRHSLRMTRSSIALALFAFSVAAQPRLIGDAERSAVGVVASYLAGGADAVYARLAADAPLRALAKEAALREIAVRMGPRDGATWTLRTAESDAALQVAWASGYADGVLVRMRGVRVLEIHTLGEGTRDSKAAARPPHSTWIAAGVLAILGAVIAARWRFLGVAVLGLAFAAGVIAYRERVPSHRSPAFVELRELAPLRETLARGREAKIPAGVSKEARDVAMLWMLQSGAAVEIGGTKNDPLASLASVAKTPLAELMRARIALTEGNEDEAVRAFDRATNVPPVRDDLLVEAATSFGDARAEVFLDRLRRLGSRDAETYYRLAVEKHSYDDFHTAWLLEPKPREELIRAKLVDDLRARSLVSFFSASEPIRRSASLAARPLLWSAGARATATGELLRVEIGNAAIEVPNGAALAPKDAQAVAATYGAQQRDAAALRDAQELLEHGDTASRARMVHAAKALAHHNRWADVLKITEDLTDTAPAELLVLRLHALLRANRFADARALADSKGVRALHDATRAAVDAHMRQIEVRRTLIANTQTIATQHFDIRHDASINPAIAARVGDLLEAELARVRQQLPPFEPRRVTVNVLGWDEFRADVTKSDHILGLYDGEIFVPFAAVEQFRREVVAVITHELTHALLAQVTGDRAPRWFQEGVATRMELVDRQENAFSGTAPNLVLPVTLLDATMERDADASAYVTAQTFIRFLEERYGPDAIAKLAAEFARGTSSDDALMKLAGKSLDALNADFRDWGFHHNGEFVTNEPWPYHDLYSPGIDPRIRAGFKFGKREP
jgi:hypothetical protein